MHHRPALALAFVAFTFLFGSAVHAQTAGVTLTAPNGGGSFTVGDATPITWTATGLADDKVDIDLSLDGGSTYPASVAEDATGGSFSWTVPNSVTTQARIRIRRVEMYAIDDVAYRFTPNGGTYDVASTAYAPRTLTAGASSVAPVNSDGFSGPHALPFTFPFFAQDKTQFFVSSNGFVSFTGVGDGCCGGQTLPATASPNDLIAGAWSDLALGGQVRLEIFGTTPNRIAAVEFLNVPEQPENGADGIASFQILLYENGGLIEIHTDRILMEGHVVTQGLKNANGTIGVPSPGINGLNASSSAQTYTDQSDANFTIATTPTGSSSSATTAIPPSIAIFQPNGGETLTAGDVHKVIWTIGGAGIHTVRISLSADGAGTSSVVAAGLFGETYDWTVPAIGTTRGRLLLEGFNFSGSKIVSTWSAKDFTIIAPPDAVVAIPITAETETVVPRSYRVDTLVKSPLSPTVYYIGLDAKRHPFPDEQTYYTWYPDFRGIQDIAPDLLALVPLGRPMLPRPGTLWIKIASDPRTYALDHAYRLRWIKDEAAALALGGPRWNRSIMTVDPSLFTQFEGGPEISADSLKTEWPTGALVKVDGGAVTYVGPDDRRTFASDAALAANRLQAKFARITPASASWTAKALGAPITGGENAFLALP